MASNISDVGYPYISDGSFTPTAAQALQGCVPIGPGVKGTVLAENSSWVKVSHGTAQGWVPFWVINVGRSRKVGDRRIVHDIAQIPSTIAPSSGPGTGTNDFERNIILLAESFKNNESRMPFLPDNVRALLVNDTQRIAAVREYIHGTHQAYVRVVCDPNSQLRDLESRIPVVTHADRRTGFYARTTTRFTQPYAQYNDSEFYSGITQDSFGNRDRDHKNPTPDMTWPAAESVRHAGSVRMYAICVWQGASAKQSLGEQLFQSMNGSYHPTLKNASLSTGATLTGTSVEDVVGYVTRTDDMEEARVIQDIQKSVFTSSGYVPLCDRPSFGVSRALNWESPLGSAEYREKVLYLKTVEPGVKDVYHRKLSKVDNDRAVFIKHGKTYDDISVAIDLHLVDEVGPARGDDCYVVFEIMHNGQHPVPYARVPDFGPFETWQMANSFAIALEWQEKGQWYKRYIQKSLLANILWMNSDEPGCDRAWAEAMGMIRFLNQITQNQPRAWEINFGIARVKEVTFDHLEQTVHLKDATPPALAWPPIVQKSKTTLTAELTALGARNIDVPYGSIHFARNRKTCDGCYLISNFDAGGTKKSKPQGAWPCVQYVDNNHNPTNVCGNSHKRGIICSWTDGPRMSNQQIRAFCRKAYQTPTAQPISPDIILLDLE